MIKMYRFLLLTVLSMLCSHVNAQKVLTLEE